MWEYTFFFEYTYTHTPPPPRIRKPYLAPRYWPFLILTARKLAQISHFDILVGFLNFYSSLLFRCFFLFLLFPLVFFLLLFFSMFLLKNVFAQFCSFFPRIWPRECHHRILRKKLYRVHKFSSKLAPGELVL